MIQAWSEAVEEHRKKDLDFSAFKELRLTEHGAVYYICENKGELGGMEEKSWFLAWVTGGQWWPGPAPQVCFFSFFKFVV